MILPKLIITDIDGVWTDGSMYYTAEGETMKRFNTYDSAGILFAKLNNIPVAIFTGEETTMVEKRAKKLGVDFLFQGVSDKVELANELCKTLKISLSDCAFIGDDLNDMQLLKCTGFSACPSNAPNYIKEIVHKSLEIKGGDGAFRSFVEFILTENNLMESTIKKYKNFKQ